MMTQSKSPLLREMELTRFQELIRERSGLELETRRDDLERAVLQMQSETALSTADALYIFLISADGQPMLETLIARLTIGETYFFRNRPQFEVLEQHILPELIEKRRATRTLRIWCAGVSSGEEPYSLAILLERLVPDLAQWNVLLLATDINPVALEKARRGLYGTWSFRDVPSELREKYFIPHGQKFEVAPYIHSRVTFAYLNLVEDVYPALLNQTNALDLILCRNVLIYFREETTRNVVARFERALNDDGWLIVGHAEPSQSIFYQFRAHNFPGTTIYQKKSAQAQPEKISRPTPSLLDRAQSLDKLIPTRTIASTPLPLSPPSLVGKGAGGLGPKPQNEIERALALWQSGQVEQALGLLKTLANASTNNAQAAYLIAKIYANRLQFDAAMEWIDKALQHEPLSAPAYYMRGLIFQEQGKTDDALEAMRRSTYADREFVLGQYALAQLFARMGQNARARKALENVARWLEPHPREELIPEGDGLTVGRLLELVAVQKTL